MKKYFGILILIVFCKVALAQQPYSRYIDYTSEWYEVRVGFVSNDGACAPNQNFGSEKWNLYRRHIIGDTTISGNNYFILQTDRRDSTRCVLGGSIFTFNQNPEYHFIREDSSGKVFHFVNNTDNLLWDFNLQIGDSIPACKIVSVDSVWLGNEPRKRFHCDCAANNFLIEGVGCPEGLYKTFSLCSIGIETNSYLVCYHKQGSMIQVDTTQICEITPFVSDIETQVIKNFAVYPNPNKGIFRITAETNSSSIVHFKLFSAIGELVYSSTIEPVANRILIDVSVSNMPTGVNIAHLVVGNTVLYYRLITAN